MNSKQKSMNSDTNIIKTKFSNLITQNERKGSYPNNQNSLLSNLLENTNKFDCTYEERENALRVNVSKVK